MTTSKREMKRYLCSVRAVPGIIHSSTVDGDHAYRPWDILGQDLGHRTVLSIDLRTFHSVKTLLRFAKRSSCPFRMFPRESRPLSSIRLPLFTIFTRFPLFSSIHFFTSILLLPFVLTPVPPTSVLMTR